MANLSTRECGYYNGAEGCFDRSFSSLRHTKFTIKRATEALNLLAMPSSDASGQLDDDGSVPRLVADEEELLSALQFWDRPLLRSALCKPKETLDLALTIAQFGRSVRSASAADIGKLICEAISLELWFAMKKGDRLRSTVRYRWDWTSSGQLPLQVLPSTAIAATTKPVDRLVDLLLSGAVNSTVCVWSC